MGDAAPPPDPDPDPDPEPPDPPLSPAERQYATQPSHPRRIHILGATQPTGQLIAHALRGLARPPPVTLLLPRPAALHAWRAARSQIRLHDGDADAPDVPRRGFDVEVAPPVRRQHGVVQLDGEPGVYDAAADGHERPHEVAARILRERAAADAADTADAAAADAADAADADATPALGTEDADPIHHLIVATRTTRTVGALLGVRHRLGAHSTVVLLQDGMGVTDEVNTHVFPHAAERPHYIRGVLTHAVHARDGQGFAPVLARRGTLALALREPEAPGVRWPPSARHLLRTLTRSPALVAVGLTPLELQQQQLERVAVACVLGPATGLLDARAGALLHDYGVTRTARLVLAEASAVMRALPELAGVVGVQTRFASARLERLVVAVAQRGGGERVMRDMRAGIETEVRFANGWVVRRGEELGMHCVVNYALMQLVMAKARVVGRERKDEVPGEGEVPGEVW